MTSRFIAPVLAATIAVTGMTAAPVQAADRGEIGRLLLGAGTLFIIGNAIANSNRNANVNNNTHVTRRHNPPQVHHQPRARKFVPSQCLRNNRAGNGPNRYFGRHCLSQHMQVGRLPGQCRTSVWTNRGQRTVFGARCLRKFGWKFS